MRSSAPTESASHCWRVSSLEVVLWTVSLGIPAVVLAGFALDLAGQSLSASSLSMLAGMTLLVVAIAMWRRDACLQAARLHLAGGLLVLGAVIGYALWLAWPTLYPTALSVDAVHHYQLIDYIFQNRSLVHDPAAAANLGEMAVYPFGATLFVAFLAWVSGLAPISLLHPAAALFIGLTALFVYGLVTELVEGDHLRELTGVLGAALLFIPYVYFITQFTRDYYFTQVFGQTWLVALAFWLTRLHLTWNKLYLVPMLSAAGALALSYPTWLATVALAMVIVLALPRAVRLSDRLAVAVWFFGPLLAFSALFLKDRWQGGLGIIRHEGALLTRDLGEIGVPFAALAVVGLFLALRQRRSWALAAFTLVLLVQTAVTFVAAALELTSYYSAYKMCYQIIYPMAALGALALSWLFRYLSAIAVMGRVPLLLGPAILLAGWFSLNLAYTKAEKYVPPLGPDLFRTATWAWEHLPNERLAYVTDSYLAPYWIETGIHKAPRSAQATDRLLGRPLMFDDWYWDGQQPDYAIVEGILEDTDEEFLLGGEVVFRSGGVGVVRRSTDQGRATLGARLSDQTLIAGGVFLITSQELPRTHYQPGETIMVNTQLTMARSTVQPYLVAAHFDDRLGRTQSQAQVLIGPGGQPLPRRGESLQVGLPLAVPADIPPDLYQIRVFVLRALFYDNVPLRRPDSPEERFLVHEPVVVLGKGDVLRPGEAEPANTLNFRLSSDIALRGFDVPARSMKVGDNVAVTLYWEAIGRPQEDYTVFLHIVDSQGRPVAQSDGYPLQGRYPTSLWQPGEVVRDVISILLPRELTAGEYRLVVGMYLLRTMARVPVLSPTGDAFGNEVGLGNLVVVP